MEKDKQILVRPVVARCVREQDRHLVSSGRSFDAWGGGGGGGADGEEFFFAGHNWRVSAGCAQWRASGGR